MGAELSRGQNIALPHTGLEVTVTASVPVACAVIIDGGGAGSRLVRHRTSAPDGVTLPREPGTRQRVTVDLTAPGPAAAADGRRLTVLIALPDAAAPGGTAGFGGRAAPRATVRGADGGTLAAFTMTGLTRESAVAVVEFYRRRGAWRLRAVGQGYADGLARMLTDYRLPGADRLAAELLEDARPAGPVLPAQRVAARPAAAGEADRPDPGAPVAGDAPGWTPVERLVNQVHGMFEDLARRIAAYRGTVEFAVSRLERETDALLADPATRLSAATEAARERAQARRDELADRARAHLDHDLAQLTAESQVVEPALPPALAGWESPVWHDYRPPAEPSPAVRLGDVHLPEVPELRIPMLARLPLERGLWVDSGTELYGGEPGGLTAEDADLARERAARTAAALAVRLLAAHPVGAFTVHLVDPTGAAAEAFGPLTRSRALRPWTGAGPDGVPGVLAAMARRVELVTAAMRAGMPRALPADLERATQLLVISGFPYDFDDRALTGLRYLADEGPAAGVHLMLIADRADARGYGPLLDPLWRSLLRLTPLPDDHLADPWVGQHWTYEPSLPPEGSRVLEVVLGGIAEARPAHGG